MVAGRNLGRVGDADQALAVPAEPVARLGPSGFDPSRLFVQSGKVRFCAVGTPIGRTDMRGKDLFTGDIVVIWTDGCLTVPDHLTVVVRKEFQSWATGFATRHDPIEPGEPFVMGIASVPLDETGEWNVLKVKHFADVIDGEHWPAYGFNYVSDPRASNPTPPFDGDEK